MNEVGLKYLVNWKENFEVDAFYSVGIAKQGVHYGRNMLIFIGCLLWLWKDRFEPFLVYVFLITILVKSE